MKPKPKRSSIRKSTRKIKSFYHADQVDRSTDQVRLIGRRRLSLEIQVVLPCRPNSIGRRPERLSPAIQVVPPPNRTWSVDRTLGLWDKQRKGSIPSETVGILIKLQRLDLAANNLGGTIPMELGLLPELTYLDLGDNQTRLQFFRPYNSQLTGAFLSQCGANLYFILFMRWRSPSICCFNFISPRSQALN